MGWIADLLEQIPSAAAYKVQLEKLDSDYKILKAENSDLRSQLEAAQAEVDRLKKQAQEKISHSSDRPAAETRILRFIAEHDGSGTEEIARSVELGVQAIRFHLHELEQIEFIFQSGRYGVDIWRLNHEGRRYLIERGLLK